MSERIKQLAKQAGISILLGNWTDEDTGETEQSRLEKFAELVIQECANVANAGIDPSESHLPGNDILQHFEVKN